MDDRLERVAVISRRLEADQGAPLSEAQRLGLVHAVNVAATGASITADLALGSIMGVNTDWPPHCIRACREAYDLLPLEGVA